MCIGLWKVTYHNSNHTYFSPWCGSRVAALVTNGIVQGDLNDEDGGGHPQRDAVVTHQVEHPVRDTPQKTFEANTQGGHPLPPLSLPTQRLSESHGSLQSFISRYSKVHVYRSHTGYLQINVKYI